MKSRISTVPLTVTAIAAIAVGVGACGSDDSGSAQPSSASGGASDSVEGKAIDACALLNADDVAKVIGARVDGRSGSSDPSSPVCVWENPSTYTSVSVTVGAPGTAPDDALPPLAPGFDVREGPDGIRFPLAGMAEFAADSRLSNVQVAVPSLPADQVDAAAVDFAQKVRAGLGR